jgi:hypothetical protein
MGTYVEEADLAARLSAEVVVRILDDDNDGAADTAPLASLIASAESRFEGAIRDIYSLSAMRTAKPGEAKRIVLDLCEAYAARRFPRAFTSGWRDRWDACMEDLKALREGGFALDVIGPPEPAENKGGEVLPGSVDDDAEDLDPVFFGGFGDF